MQALVKLTNIYISSKKQMDQSPSHSLLEGLAKYLTRMLKVFGANEGEQEIGFPSSNSSGAANVRNLSV